MVFETKKIKHETLGEYLAEVRRQLGLSASEVAKRTGIKQKFFEKLESGNLAGLPADVYIFGFLRQLAQLYSLDPEMLISQYKKERGIQQQLERRGSFYKKGTARYLSRIVITPKFIGVAIGVLFVAVTVGYIIWQVLSINQTPSLEIIQPQDNELIKQTSIDVAGKTDPGTSLTLNGQSVFVDEQGNFTTQIGLAPGPKQLVFVASNKFDKSVTKTVSVIGDDSITSTSTPVTLALQFTDAASITIAIDDQPARTLSFKAGDTETFSAAEKIVLSTSNAGATHAVLNHQNLGALGRPGEKLANVSFSPDSDTIPTQ